MDVGAESRRTDDGVDPLELHQLRIRDINTDESLSSDEKTRAVSKLSQERNAEFLRGTQAASEDEKEPPIKRQANHHHHHSPCGSGCGRASDAGMEEEEDEEEKDFSHVLCEACIKLESEGQTRGDNCKSCLSARDRAKCEHFYKYVRRFDGRFPGRNARPCPHYQRDCWLLAKCCDRYFPCRRCHDEIMDDHTINRHETEFVGCSRCGAEKQPAEKGCGECGYQFASYFCRVCRFYDNDETKPVYHCEHCGICRMGKGLGIDQHHCHKCKTCVPIDVADNHPCMDSSVQSACPVCLVFMATSTEQVLFMRCGHAIHASCFERYTKVKYNCPLCFKALTDMSAWYRALDATLAQEEMPPEYKNRLTHIICNDCDLKSIAKFHFKFHKCFKCDGYNTRVLSHFDLSNADACAAERYKAEEMARQEAADSATDRNGASSAGVEGQSGSVEGKDSSAGPSDEAFGKSRGVNDNVEGVTKENGEGVANKVGDVVVVDAESHGSPAVQESSVNSIVDLSPGGREKSKSGASSVVGAPAASMSDGSNSGASRSPSPCRMESQSTASSQESAASSPRPAG